MYELWMYYPVWSKFIRLGCPQESLLGLIIFFIRYVWVIIIIHRKEMDRVKLLIFM